MGKTNAVGFQIMAGPLTIDPEKIQAKITWHHAEIKRLNGALDLFEGLKEFAVDAAPASNGAASRGRPPVGDNPLLPMLREFVEGRDKDFTHADLKKAVGYSDRKDRVRDAIAALEAAGIMKVVTKPMGRQPGCYRPLKGNRDSGAGGLNRHPAPQTED